MFTERYVCNTWPGYLHVLALLLAWLLPSTAVAQTVRTFRFDNEPHLDAPLEFHFSRGAPSLALDGSPLGPDIPRFRDTTLLSPLPAVTKVPGTVGEPAVNILGAGVAADGTTPVWVVAVLSKAKLQVHVGNLPGTVYEVSMPYVWTKGNQMDALFESVDAQPGEAWRPVSGTICHGLIILQCNVAVPGPSGWVSNRVGFMVCTIADLAGPKNRWWRRHALSDPLSPLPAGVGLGGAWSIQSWWSTERNGLAPTSAWIAATDYHSAPAKDGGTYFVFRMRRPDPIATRWSIDPVVELPGRWNDPTNRSHSHTLGITRYGSRGIAALGSRGDSLGNAAVLAWTLADEDLYAAGASPAPGGHNWLRAGPLWLGPQIVHGNLDGPVPDLRTHYSGNQFIGLAPGPTEGTFIAGSDEVTEVLWQTLPLSIGPLGLVAPITFNTPWKLSQTMPILDRGEGPWRHYLCFHIKTPTPERLGGEYVAQLSPSQNDMDSWANQRIAYSPDGVHWAQVWSHFENMQTIPWIASGRIWIGSYGKNACAGIRSIPVPDVISARPLTVAPGGLNAAVAAPLVQDLGVGVQVQVNPSLPPQVSPPPCLGPWYHISSTPISADTGSPALGRYRLAAGIPSTSREISIRAWIRCDTPAELGRAQSTILMGSLRASDALSTPSSTRTSGTTCSIALSSAGEWIPVVITTDLTQWASPANWGPEGGRLDLILTSAWNVTVPVSFYLAIESVSINSTPTYPSAVETTLPPENAEIRGFDAPGSWTLFVAAKVPDASWDSSYSGPSPAQRPLFSIVSRTGQSWVDVLADRSQGSIIIRPGGSAAGHEEQVNNFNWWPGSPVLLSVSHCAQWDGFMLRGSVGNAEIKSTFPVYGRLDSPAASLRFGSGDGSVSELDIFGGAFVHAEATQEEVRTVLQRLPMLRGEPLPPLTGDCSDMEVKDCTADFDGSGFIDTDDFDRFMQAFETGDDSADYDRSGFVDTDDFDGFIQAFEAGC